MKRRAVNKPAAYVTFGTFMSALDRLQASSLTEPLNLENCGASSSATWYHLRSTLRFFELIDPHDMPTVLLKSLLSDRKRILGKLLRKHYHEVFAADPSQITLSQLNRLLAASGVKRATLQRARSFFLGAAWESRVRLSPQLQKALSGRRTGNPQTTDRKVVRTARMAESMRANKSVSSVASNMTLTLSFDLAGMSESDHELLHRLSYQLVSLHARTQSLAGRLTPDPVNKIEAFSEESDDEPVH
jgi:hypothetical protein